MLVGKEKRTGGWGGERENETIVDHQPDQPLFTVEKGENWEFCHTVLMSGSNSAKRSLVLSELLSNSGSTPSLLCFIGKPKDTERALLCE